MGNGIADISDTGDRKSEHPLIFCSGVLTHHQMSEFDAGTLTERIVSKVSHRKDVDPVELQPPLNEVVDLAALDALFASRNGGTTRNGDGHVEFTYEGYRIRVESDGIIDIDEVGGGE